MHEQKEQKKQKKQKKNDENDENEKTEKTEKNDQWQRQTISGNQIGLLQVPWTLQQTPRTSVKEFTTHFLRWMESKKTFSISECVSHEFYDLNKQFKTNHRKFQKIMKILKELGAIQKSKNGLMTYRPIFDEKNYPLNCLLRRIMKMKTTKKLIEFTLRIIRPFRVNKKKQCHCINLSKLVMILMMTQPKEHVYKTNCSFWNNIIQQFIFQFCKNRYIVNATSKGIYDVFNVMVALRMFNKKKEHGMQCYTQTNELLSWIEKTKSSLVLLESLEPIMALKKCVVRSLDVKLNCKFSRIRKKNEPLEKEKTTLLKKSKRHLEHTLGFRNADEILFSSKHIYDSKKLFEDDMVKHNGGNFYDPLEYKILFSTNTMSSQVHSEFNNFHFT
jgi:hypothetical protein